MGTTKNVELVTSELSFEQKFDFPAKVVLMCSLSLHVFLNGDLKTSLPGGSGTGVWKFDAKDGDLLSVYTDLDQEVVFTTYITPLPSRFDPSGGDKLVEIVPPDEMNVYDKLRSEMLGYLNQIAEKKGLDTIDDEDDLEFDEEEDENLILTPYEYKAMEEEFPIDDKKGIPVPASSEEAGRPASGSEPANDEAVGTDDTISDDS